jgi:hypothetical protein
VGEAARRSIYLLPFRKRGEGGGLVSPHRGSSIVLVYFRDSDGLAAGDMKNYIPPHATVNSYPQFGLFL